MYISLCREIYDALSLMFIKAEVFSYLIRLIVTFQTQLTPLEYRSVARIFELCACHPDGISILQKYLPAVIDMVDLFMHLDDSELITVKYPAATVLLDLTANEGCIEKVAGLIQAKDLFQVIVTELEVALARKIGKTCPNRVYLNRYRDLMIGIVLNLTCNVESDDITEYMV